MIVDTTDEKKIASFSKVKMKGTMYVNDKRRDYWRCELHGDVELQPFHEHVIGMDGQEYVRVTYSCSKCLLTYLKTDEIKPALEKHVVRASTSEMCGHALCYIHDNLESCEMCGRSCCPKHRVEKVCSNCANDTTLWMAEAGALDY